MIQILMSTYNGEKYIQEQLESLLNQSYKNFKILIRDDGSKDRTREIILKYKKNYPEKIEFFFEDNIGVINSFFELINRADSSCNYFAFCDQDDIWLDNKLYNAKRNIKIDIPFLYFSDKILVNENLQMLKNKNKNKNIKINLESSIIENLATGCTIVINKKMLNLIKDRFIDVDKILMHDWYMYILSNLLGENYYDKNAYIYYRQHSNNVVGAENNIFKKNIKRMKRFLLKRKKDTLKLQAREILTIYSREVAEEKYEQVLEILEAKKIRDRYKILKEGKLRRQNWMDNLIFKILYICGWL